MTTTDLLAPLRARAGSVRTTGLDDATVNRLSGRFPELREAAEAAVAAFADIQAEFPELVDADEQAQIAAVQSGFINFYDEDAVNPYVAIAAPNGASRRNVTVVPSSTASTSRQRSGRLSKTGGSHHVRSYR